MSSQGQEYQTVLSLWGHLDEAFLQKLLFQKLKETKRFLFVHEVRVRFTRCSIILISCNYNYVNEESSQGY